MGLKPHELYRIAYNADDRELRGQPCVFHEERVFVRGDIRRCRVSLLNGKEYLVSCSIIIPLTSRR